MRIVSYILESLSSSDVTFQTTASGEKLFITGAIHNKSGCQNLQVLGSYTPDC